MRINMLSQGLTDSKITSSGRDDTRLRKACQEFESVLVSYMLGQMRNTVPKSDLMGSSDKEEIFQSMLDQEIAGELSRTDSLKIAELLYMQLSQIEGKR